MKQQRDHIANRICDISVISSLGAKSCKAARYETSCKALSAARILTVANVLSAVLTKSAILPTVLFACVVRGCNRPSVQAAPQYLEHPQLHHAKTSPMGYAPPPVPSLQAPAPPAAPSSPMQGAMSRMHLARSPLELAVECSNAKKDDRGKLLSIPRLLPQHSEMLRCSMQQDRSYAIQ